MTWDAYYIIYTEHTSENVSILCLFFSINKSSSFWKDSTLPNIWVPLFTLIEENNNSGTNLTNTFLFV